MVPPIVRGEGGEAAHAARRLAVEHPGHPVGQQAHLIVYDAPVALLQVLIVGVVGLGREALAVHSDGLAVEAQQVVVVARRGLIAFTAGAQDLDVIETVEVDRVFLDHPRHALSQKKRRRRRRGKLSMLDCCVPKVIVVSLQRPEVDL
eukprot:scaffold5939_cov165-Ochromonas_danica.AAC.9